MMLVSHRGGVIPFSGCCHWPRSRDSSPTFGRFIEHVTVRDDVAPEDRLRDIKAGPLERFFIAPSHFQLPRASPRASFDSPLQPHVEERKSTWSSSATIRFQYRKGYTERLLRSSEGTSLTGVKTMSHNVSERIPLPLVTVACEFCGSTEGEPLTGALTDERTRRRTPRGVPSLSLSVSFVARIAALSICASVRTLEDVPCYYPDTYKCFQSLRPARIHHEASSLGASRSRKLRRIARLMPRGNETLLDYGCGSGTWLSLLEGSRLLPIE